MKLKILVVDMELTRRQRVIGGGLLAGGLALAISTVALAKVKTDFASGETLTAADLNANFTDLDGRTMTLEATTDDLDTRVEALEAAPTSATATGTAAQAGTATYTPVTYTHADLVLSPGTWLVQGYASLTITVNDDGTALGLFNVTTNARVPNSFGAVETLRTTDSVHGLTTAQTVITVMTQTTLRLQAVQNGNSIPAFVDFDDPVVATVASLKPHKLTAVKLR